MCVIIWFLIIFSKHLHKIQVRLTIVACQTFLSFLTNNCNYGLKPLLWYCTYQLILIQNNNNVCYFVCYFHKKQGYKIVYYTWCLLYFSFSILNTTSFVIFIFSIGILISLSLILGYFPLGSFIWTPAKYFEDVCFFFTICCHS